MKFGPVPVAELEGAILAHSLKVEGKTLKKGRLLSAGDASALAGAGHVTVVAAQLEPDDVPEDAAAARLAEAVRGPGLRASAPFTGRCNLFAEQAGLLVFDEGGLDAFNFVSEELTVATLAPYTVVSPRQMVATIKVIPFSAPEASVAQCERIAREAAGLLRVQPFASKRVGYVQTRLDGTKDSVLDKSRRVLDQRLERLASRVSIELRCAHDTEAVAAAVSEALETGAELVLIAGASAIVDRRDVVPAGIERAGGGVDHFGMPVDPGNLLLLAHHGAVPVIGLPGCARSPKMSGFDYVLRRLVADLPVVPADVMRMGAFGLLKEHSERPSPRSRGAPAAQAPAREAHIGALVLAAGQSRRMGARNKLLEQVDERTMVEHAARAALGSAAHPVVVVTGHEHERVAQALRGLDVVVVHNPDYVDGLSTSLRRGIAALPDGVEGVLVCLADMPRVEARHLDRLIAAFDPLEGRAICVPTHGGKRGNPVLFGRQFFPEMLEVRGDVGARHLIGDYEEATCEVEMDDRAVLTDIDSPQALRELYEVTAPP